jgi:transposase-like protein
METKLQTKQSSQDIIKKAIDVLVDSGIDLTTSLQGGELMNQFKKAIVERALQVEFDEHLGYEKHERSDTPNYRNGKITKSIITENGPIQIENPRDRNSTFEPIIIPKRQTRIDGLDQKIIYLYAKGMSVTDIQDQLKELYGGAEISTALISKITDAVIEDAIAWQNRALDEIYPIVYFDALVVKIRQDKKILNKAVNIALGINKDGNKEVLGLWISDNEGAKFWLSVFTELKNRGLRDILIACTDNLQGMTEAMQTAYPKTSHQLCIVHQIRNSLNLVSYKDRKSVAGDLKPIYTAVTEEEAMSNLESFSKKWNKQYPSISKSWHENWLNLTIFLHYPEEIRRVIYTTNPIESLNNNLRKVTRNKRVFPTDDAVLKNFFLVIHGLSKKWTMPIKNWHEAMSHFMIVFEERLSLVKTTLHS